MKFSKSLLDEIRDKIEISDVVGKRVALQKRGKEYIGLSPFQNEKTPSFTVNDEKQFYHCFSSNKHGDIFTFLVEVEGFSFPQAVEKLADQAGVEIRTLSKEEEKRAEIKKKLYSVTERAKDFFITNLNSNNRALNYLKNRGIDKKIIETYEIGYALNDFSSLQKYLSSKGISNEEMVLAGLVIESNKKQGNFYDRYRDRIIFPINDNYGRVAGFGGRVLNDEDMPKGESGNMVQPRDDHPRPSTRPDPQGQLLGHHGKTPCSGPCRRPQARQGGQGRRPPENKGKDGCRQVEVRGRQREGIL